MSSPMVERAPASGSKFHRRTAQSSLRRNVDLFISRLVRAEPGRRPSNNASRAAAACLGVGLLLSLLGAFGVGPPPFRRERLGSDVTNAANNAPPEAEAKHNPYAKLTAEKGAKKKRRLAVIIPYLPPSDGAPTFPPYFDLFASSAAGSASRVDFLIFHCFVPPSLQPDDETLPSNVKLIDLTERNGNGGRDECGLARLFARVTDLRQKEGSMRTPLETLVSRLSHRISDVPYILVEYKPALGHIFADYLKEYTHWGYSDLDVVFGDVPRWIDEDEWSDYDVVTYGFGDQDKLYLRGQFTFHKNDPRRVNQLWRHCRYLSEMDVRYADPQNVRFESAEGCYSQAVLSRKDVKVKWAVKAYTDVEGGSIFAHGIYLSLGSKPSLTSSKSYNPKSVLYTATEAASGSALLDAPHDWFEDATSYPKYAEGIPIQKYVGEKTKVRTYRTLYERGDESAKDVKCMYWAPKTYQMDICTVEGTVKSDEVVTLEDGVLYKRKFVHRNKIFPEGIASFPFFHFQCSFPSPTENREEWKRTYRFTQLLPARNVRRSNAMAGLIVTKEGALPLLSAEPPPSGWNFPRGGGSGRARSSSWTNADAGSTSSKPSSNRFCLKSSPKSYPKGATACESAASWPRPGETRASSCSIEDGCASVTILRSPADPTESKATVRGTGARAEGDPWWSGELLSGDDVTLALTLQITTTHMREPSVVEALLAVADSNLRVWGARPKVLAIHVDPRDDEGDAEGAAARARAMRAIEERFDPSRGAAAEAAHLRNALVAVVDSGERDVSRNALLNMAAFAAPTRWIVSGLEVERGLVLSKEAAVYAAREAKVHADLPGHVFYVPQFASSRDDTRAAKDAAGSSRLVYTGVGAELLPSIRGKKTMTSDLSEYDCVKCATEDTSDKMDDENRRRLTDASLPAKSDAEELLVNMWWDLSVADVYGTPGGFNGAAGASLGAMAKAHDRIELALLSLLDQSDEHVDRLRYFDQSPILMIDRLGPQKEMMTLDLAPEEEAFGGRTCFRLLRLAQLAALGFKVDVLTGAFAASYPDTRASLCTERIRTSGPERCDCDLDSEDSIEEILMDEAKRPGKVAVLMGERARASSQS
ncbi:hypothetical protein ACHAWF_018977 [Thalassiosira exigua]